MPEHCANLNGDRALGARWEREFCKLAAQEAKVFTPHQIGRDRSAAAHCAFNGKWHSLTLPDVTVWSAPGEHHEIKHKKPTDSGHFGLEDYRLRALKWFADETKQSVFYTIHRWDTAGGRHIETSQIKDWITANIEALWLATQNGTANKARFNSYVGGQKKMVDGWFWPINLWRPLMLMWNDNALTGLNQRSGVVKQAARGAQPKPHQ